jgi:hypothetical protein
MMLGPLLLLLAAFPPLQPRAPWQPDPNLPRQKVEWTALLRNPEIRFLTDNQLSVTLDKTPGIAKFHYYPVRRRVELAGKLDYEILARETRFEGVGARVHFPFELRESNYEWRPDGVTRTWEGHGSRVREEITVQGNVAVVRLTRLAGAPLDVTIQGQLKDVCETATVNGKPVLRFPDGVALAPATANGSPAEITKGAYALHARLDATLAVVVAAGYQPESVAADRDRALATPQSVFEAAHATWDYYFTVLVPRLATANPALDRLYYYLFYVVRSSLFDIPFAPYSFPYTCPWKTGAIWQWSWNTPMNAVTERWLNDSSLAKSGLRLIAVNGGGLYFGTYLHPFHAAPPRSIFDWYPEVDAAQKKLEAKDYEFLSVLPYSVPNAFLGVHEVYLMTGDSAFLDENLPLMKAYELEARRRAPRGSVLTPFQMMVDEFDYSLRWKPVQGTFTKGGLQRAFDLPVEMVDVNSYLYVLRGTLADAYRERSDFAAERTMRQLAERTAREVNARFWDPTRDFYCDTRSDNHASTGVRAISGFAPLYAGIVPAERRAKLVAALDDPKGFGAPYPAPSISLDHPDLDPGLLTYGGDSLITTGVWTLVNALAASGEDARASKLLARTVEMMTRNGVSSSYSYNSLTGAPNQDKHTLSTQSAIVNDLIARYVVGLTPVAGDEIEFHPLAAALAGGQMHFGPFRYKDRHWVEVWQSGSTWRVTIDGASVTLATPRRVRLRLSDASVVTAQ